MGDTYWQAKHVNEGLLLGLLGELERDGSWRSQRRWVLGYELQERMPYVPWKVMRAKLAKLIKQGKIGGCACGCRGDFYTRDVEGIATWG